MIKEILAHDANKTISAYDNQSRRIKTCFINKSSEHHMIFMLFFRNIVLLHSK